MKILLRTIAFLILLMGVIMGYLYLTQPKMPAVPPVPASRALQAPDKPAVAATGGSRKLPGAAGVAAVSRKQDILVIKIGGSVSGTVKIALDKKLAPKNVARLEALARAGAYDNVVFHRVIDGFMAQTGDVKYGKRGGDLSKAGLGGSDKPDLVAEFSKEPFVKGVVGMARSRSPNSANSQFFIMYGDAPYLDGKYTIVGHVIAGQNVIDKIRKGDPARNGTVKSPDYMKKVTILPAG